jgi:hypothetical protein
MDAALARIETAIESALIDAGIDGSIEAQLDEPVVLEIGPDGLATDASWTALVERLREVAAATATDPQHRNAGPVTATSDLATSEELPGNVRPEDHGGRAMARTLARWSRGGQLARVAAAWPEPLLHEWLAAVGAAAEAGGPGTVGELADEATQEIAAVLLGGVARVSAQDRRAAERLLVVLGALTVALGDRLPGPATQAAARTSVISEPDAFVDVVAAPRARRPEPERNAADEPEGQELPEVAVGRVVPALALLVLAQLSRIGYVDGMEAAARAAGLPGGGAALGGAVAGKVLAPPVRGWRRDPSELAAIALASGGRAGRDWTADVGRRADALVPALSAALVAAYADGRSANDEVLVAATSDGVLVGEEEGLLPIAWVAARDGLDVTLNALGCPPVRRGDEFRPLVEALTDRRALPRTRAAALERHLGAAVGTALGVLALDLWGPSATALDALERLGDLEARAEPTLGALSLEIPRGRRWMDLSRAGLLDWFRIPWLAGGRLEVGTW